LQRSIFAAFDMDQPVAHHSLLIWTYHRSNAKRSKSATGNHQISP